MRNFSYLFLLAFAMLLLPSCTQDPDEATSGNGKPLELFARFGLSTRLAELPSDQISVPNNGLVNVGLYIYYKDDYDRGIVTRPYVRNLQCMVVNGRLMPITGELIYIYDRMTLVAFYPYNGNVADFTAVSDEESYPITMSDYSQQTYIPYRAQTSVDPTVAYKVGLHFTPKHTSKIEVTIVGSPTTLPTLSNPSVLPYVDPVNAAPGNNHRQRMVDFTNSFINSGGGMSVMQYVAYVWTHNEGSGSTQNDGPANIVKQGDPIFQSDELTLTATQQIDLSEDRVYRFGYNMTTGEIFIPTSSSLVYDANSMATQPYGYQVCDIDLSGISNWTPVNLSGNTFDGGGHQITGLTITSLPIGGNTGLFGQLQGNATITNINLVAPKITINAGTSAAYVGALCGSNNQMLRLTAADLALLRAQLVASLPPNVADVVIDALLADQVKMLQNGTATIQGCRVSNASITLNGVALKAGLLCGKNGDSTAAAQIKNSYATGVINANIGAGIVGDTCKIAGFVGVNNATINQCYSTGTATAEAYLAAVYPATSPTKINSATGFCFNGTSYSSNNGSVASCYTLQANPTPVIPQFSASSWPAWSVYTGKWPIYNVGATSLWRSMGNKSTPLYPMLVWERQQ